MIHFNRTNYDYIRILYLHIASNNFHNKKMNGVSAPLFLIEEETVILFTFRGKYYA